MNLGDTFIWSSDRRSKRHLYIAVTDPNKNGGDFVAFNLTRARGGPKALTLKIGQHPFIMRYDSEVNFGDGLIVSSRKIANELACGNASPDAPMDIKLVEKIARYAADHPAVSGEIQKLVSAEWGT